MANKQLDRALYGPSLFEVTLGAILSVLLGGIVAVLFLVLKPVEVVKVLPKEDERVQGAVYFVEGSKDTGRGKQWMRKRQMMLDGAPGTISLTEDELNTWFASDSGQKTTKPAPKPAPKPAAKPGQPAAPAAAEDVPSDLVTWSELNFRMHDGLLQVGLPASLNLSALAISFPIIIQSDGKFDKRDDMQMYIPTSLMIGSLQLDRFPGVTAFLTKKVLRAAPQDILTAWKKVSTVAVDGKMLKLTIQ